jgi:hypothetical protein
MLWSVTRYIYFNEFFFEHNIYLNEDENYHDKDYQNTKIKIDRIKVATLYIYIRIIMYIYERKKWFNKVVKDSVQTFF